MNFRLQPNAQVLGARVVGLDLSRPLSATDRLSLIAALGRHGVLCFPEQHLTPRQQRDFAANFGTLEINVAANGQETDIPEMMTLSNIIENGKPIGLSDAGQDWHTDMSYSQPSAFVNVNYAPKVPVRDGRPLGDTEFLDMYRAYDDLSENLKAKIEGRTATHDFNKFWEQMLKRPGTQRKPLTVEQRRQKPPVHHPIVLEHPISGRRALYCNVGYVTAIDGLPQAESDAILETLFEHQMRDTYKWAHHWTEGDVLVWDNMSTVHNAVADYRADEPRLMRRCQVMADWVFSPAAKTAAKAA